MRIRDPGTGVEKIWDPGSAILRISLNNFAEWQVPVGFATRELILNLMRKVLKVGLKSFWVKGHI
jgi:hypothetical protein